MHRTEKTSVSVLFNQKGANEFSILPEVQFTPELKHRPKPTQTRSQDGKLPQPLLIHKPDARCFSLTDVLLIFNCFKSVISEWYNLNSVFNYSLYWKNRPHVLISKTHEDYLTQAHCYVVIASTVTVCHCCVIWIHHALSQLLLGRFVLLFELKFYFLITEYKDIC